MDIAEAKARLRREILAARSTRTAAQRAADATALSRRVLAMPELARPTTVAAYESLPTEPGTGPLLAALSRFGHRVLLPVLLPDRDLDWVQAPDGDRHGVNAIAQASVVICPGLAADRHGHRLGRGGGSYDRALGRCSPAARRVLLLHDEELVDAVPTHPHDQSVHCVITPGLTVVVAQLRG